MSEKKKPERIKLRDDIVKALKQPEKGQKLIWDTECRGFGVRLTGGAKSFIVQGIVNGKDRRVKIASTDTFSTPEARKKARAYLQQMASGIDPNLQKRQQETASITLSSIVDDYKANKRTREGHPLKVSTKADIDKHLKGVFACWADKPIASITREMVISKYREAAKSSTAQANQAFRILRGLYNWARATTKQSDGNPILPENPVQALNDLGQWGHVPTRKTRIPDARIGHAWNFLQEIMLDPFQTALAQMKAAYLSFLLLTGCRASEAATLKWDQVDLEKNIWKLPDPKNRNPVIFPLSSQAKAILEARQGNGEHVFLSKHRKGRVIDCRHYTTKLSELIKEKITPHDLRRTFRAIAGSCGVELWKTKLLMNHKLSGDVTISSYTETSDLRYLQPEAQQIGSYIERQGRIASSAKVVDIEHARKQAANG